MIMLDNTVVNVALHWCGLAGGAASLIAARTVQGVGAALIIAVTTVRKLRHDTAAEPAIGA